MTKAIGKTYNTRSHGAKTPKRKRGRPSTSQYTPGAPRIPKRSRPRTYEVEKIIGKRTRGGKTQYLVQWAGYEGQDTWEPEEHLENCEEVLKRFEESQSKDTDVGTPRKVGRPRKASETYSTDEEKEQKSSATKVGKKRGRKGKDDSGGHPTPKRGRGRPRKNVATSK